MTEAHDKNMREALDIVNKTPEVAEWEKEFDELFGIDKDEFQTAYETHIKAFITTLLSSHEEKVRAEIANLKANIPPYPHEGAHGHAITLAAQRGYQDALDTILSKITYKTN